MRSRLAILGSAVFFLLLLPCSSFPVVARDLSFEERVRAQEAIERVYYAHQIGATKSFEEAVPKDLLRRKVRTYLAQSAALERIFGTSVTAPMLRAELERMAGATRLPERLRELEAALGDDPFLVAECLARPVLVDRMIRKAIGARTWDEWWSETAPRFESTPVVAVGAGIDRLPSIRFDAESCPSGDGWDSSFLGTPDPRDGHTAIWTGSVMVVWGGAGAGHYRTGGRYDPATDTWALTSTANAPSARTNHTAIWTGSRMIVWGGSSFENGDVYRNTGGRYDPVANSWEPTSLSGAPVARHFHTTIWTGATMVVWGGTYTDQFGSHYPDGGGRYNPTTDTWSPTATVGAPVAREQHTAVWTGTTMVAWGGSFRVGPSDTFLSSGGRYDPASDTWSPTTQAGAPVATRDHTAIWTGTRMIVWGGGAANRYDPVANTWSAVSSSGAPAQRESHTAVWTGSRMIVWGGGTNAAPLSTGGLYDPVTNSWTLTSPTDAPQARTRHAAVWTGTRMVVWGGYGLGGGLNSGGQLDPASGTWTATNEGISPRPRHEHSAVWTGTLLIVWGGHYYDGGDRFLGTGGRYDPATDTWSQLADLNAPTARRRHSALWTGSDMIVWGGSSDAGPLRSGSRYDPIADTWTLVETVGAPGVRESHSAVWTGTEMIVWGGQVETFPYSVNTGARYDPITDTWIPVSLVNAPSARDTHTAVWTGSEMIVWGGALSQSGLDTGGRYDPGSDSWTPTSTAGAPSGRYYQTAIWTGSRMVVWGGAFHSGADQPLDTGGSYDPLADSWTPTTMAGAPAARYQHTAVWSGSEMVVWGGGVPLGTLFGFLDDGGKYDPQADTWSPMSVDSPPVARREHAAVWAGGVMLLWGGWADAYLNSGGRYSLDQGLDHDGDGYSVCAGDCNDSNQAISPIAVEICDGIDNDCDGVVDFPNPTVVPSVTTAKSGTVAVVSWALVSGAVTYDAVKGSLGPLRNSGGNFTTATTGCIANDTTGTTAQDTQVPPGGGGIWYTVRTKSGCGVVGTYNEPGTSQVGSRDAEINAAGPACP